MTRRILVASEHPDAEPQVLSWAADEAGKHAAELLLLQVRARQEGDGSSAAPAPDDALTRRARELAGPSARGLTVSSDDAAEAIVHAAQDLHADLIVCGNSGMHGRKEFLLKNVPNRVSHLAHCDVVLVNTADGESQPHRPHFHHHQRPPVVPADPAMFEGRMLGRAAEIGRVVASLGMREVLIAKREQGDLHREAKVLRESLTKLGPTFEKLGQMLSTRPDLLPREFIEELQTLQDDVPPMSQGEVVGVMERELQVPWEDVFASVDPAPIAAGTIAQVHTAVLAGGDHVVLKVQRPTAEEEMCKDLALLQLFAERARGRPTFQQIVDLPAIIEHLSTSLQHELDFQLEAANVERMAEVLAPYQRLGVPRVYREYSTHRLLVLERIDGVPLAESEASTERSEAARQLVESYYQQVLTAGFFHADPHPGNLKWWNDRIYLLDFGMVGEIDEHTRELLGYVLLAFWHEDVSFLADVIVMLSEQHGSVDADAFHADLAELVQRYRHLALEQFQLGPMLQDMTQLCVRHNIRLPASLALIGKALGQMQLAAAQCDPSIDPFSVAGHFFTRALTTRVREMVGPHRLVYNAQKLKLRLTSLMDSLEKLTGARPGWEPKIVFRGTERLEDTIRRAARRLATAFVATAAFIVCGLTASFAHIPGWVPILFGGLGGAFALLLLLDFAHRGG